MASEQKRYSVKSKGNRWHVQFASMAPADVRDKLKASKHCQYIQPRKMWVCKDKGAVQAAEKLLQAQGWVRAPDVVPELAPLRVDMQPNAANNTVTLSFNRAPEAAMAQDIGSLQAQRTDDKRVWTAPCDRQAELRRYFVMTNVDMAASADAPPPDPLPLAGPPAAPAGATPLPGEPVTATLAVQLPDKLVLQFAGGLPTCDKVAEMRGALIALGIQVQPSLVLQEGGAPPLSPSPASGSDSEDSEE